jgi:hypothetical protein
VLKGNKASTVADMYSFGKLIQNTKQYHSSNSDLDALIAKLLFKDPSKRITASETLFHPFFKSNVADVIKANQIMKELYEERQKIAQEDEKLTNQRNAIIQDNNNLEQERKRILAIQIDVNKGKRETQQKIEELRCQQDKLRKEWLKKEEELKEKQKKVQRDLEIHKKNQSELKIKEKELVLQSFPPWYWQMTVFGSFSTIAMREVIMEQTMKGRIQDVITKSCITSTLGQGRDQRVTQKYSKLEVLKVVRIENPVLWKRYCLTKDEIKIQGTVGKKIKVASWDKWMQKSVLDSDVNELYLFHGTKPEYIKLIKSQGFDERVCQLDGLFGAGIYFGIYYFQKYN